MRRQVILLNSTEPRFLKEETNISDSQSGFRAYDKTALNQNFSEHDPEHKSFNIIRLHNGQFAAQPNNRVVWSDQSLIASKVKTPDFKVCTQNYCVEKNPKWSVGHTDDWSYRDENEE